MSLADDIYGAVYLLAMAALNPGYDPETDGDVPPVPVLKDQQAEASPLLTQYVTIQGTPALTASGTVERGVQGADDSRNLDHNYTAEVVLWEVYGNGSKLQQIQEFMDTEEALGIMDSTGVSVLRPGPILDLSTTLGDRWIPQARTTISVSAKSRNTETLSTIARVEWANAENPANSGSVEYPTD